MVPGGKRGFYKSDPKPLERLDTPQQIDTVDGFLIPTVS